MEEFEIQQFTQGLETAFINQNINSSLAYRPQFISNNYREGKKVLSSLEDELKDCDAFFFSVAFITQSGIVSLLPIFAELEKKGVPGRILTTDYLNFSEPVALQKLNKFSNIEIKMYRTGSDRHLLLEDIDKHDSKEGFHTKGYVFKKGKIYRIIVGSSNMTQYALTRNKEWNTKIISTQEGEYARNLISEFEALWTSKRAQNFDDFFEEYEKAYKIIKEQKKIAREAVDKTVELEAYKLKPNKMQTAVCYNLQKIVEKGENKALLISATGTGKTYASAFALRELKYKKVLFLVHRNQIVKQACESYKRVFGSTRSMGMISGSLGKVEDNINKDFIFSTRDTMSKDYMLKKFAPDHFDAIVYDEAHHSSSSSYQKIMDYFTPKFSLGMTATPDKRDDNIEGQNIYEIFDHNIVYEIRIKQAMEEDLLCPFHYFGITDLEEIGDETVVKEKDKESAEALRKFRYLVCDERVDYVMQQAEFYGYSGDRVKGLIFVSTKKEARELSAKFNERGWKTAVLTGEDSPEQRAEEIERLVKNVEPGDEDYLDYIISIDIFSEGVDIPEINQVIMMRPTESPIVFIQQLGRGLRKDKNKEFVVVIDFIGNYKTNFMIPIALTGDRSYDKDTERAVLDGGSRILPGSSTVHFDEISRQRIYDAIDSANYSDIKLIKNSYANLKNKIGRIPKLADFDDYGEIDVLRIIENKSLGSYYKFLEKYEKEYAVRLSEDEANVVEFISKKFANGKRLADLVMLSNCLDREIGLVGSFADEMEEIYHRTVTPIQMQNIINVFTNNFPTGSGKKTYEKCVLLESIDVKDLSNEFVYGIRLDDGPMRGQEPIVERLKRYANNLCGMNKEYRVSKSFKKMLENKDFRDIVEELVVYGLNRNEAEYAERYQDTDFVLYKKYTYDDICRLLNWEHSEVALNIGGYKYDKNTKTFPVFINYEKEDNIADTIKYEDRFVNDECLISISKGKRTVESEDVQNFLKAKERGIDVQLFVRKNKDDKTSKEFYYFGRMEATGKTKEFVMPNTNSTAVEIEWKLDKPVREDIYKYIVNG